MAVFAIFMATLRVFPEEKQVWHVRRISDLMCPGGGELWRGEDGEGDDDDHAVLSHVQLSH